MPRTQWTYQGWRWDLTVYHCARCRDHMLLPYAIWSLQGYPGELVCSSGTDIILDNVLMILDEHYNNVKVLGPLNQELFQLQMADKETISDWGVCLSRHLQVLAASFPNCFLSHRVAELKWDCFYGRLPKWLKLMAAYLKASLHEKNVFQLPSSHKGGRKGKNLWSYLEIHRARQWIMLLNQKALVSSLCRSSKATNWYLKWLPCHLAHLKEEGTKRDKEVESEDPDNINRATEEFMVCLMRAVKDPQLVEKCCYHCSSNDHFNLQVSTSEGLKGQCSVKLQGGDSIKEGSLDPLMKVAMSKNPQEEVPKW